MLRVELSALEQGPIETDGVVAADDPIVADVEFELAEPIEVRGRLMESGAGRYYWHGTLRTRVAASCRRCLKDVAVEVAPELRVLFTEDPSGDDAAAYALPPQGSELDLGEMVREELILAAPPFVVCRDDCRGLCPRCGKDLNEGPCDCRPEPDPRWAKLEGLKGMGSDEER